MAEKRRKSYPPDSTKPQDASPVLQARKKVHEERLGPLQEENQANQSILAGLQQLLEKKAALQRQIEAAEVRLAELERQEEWFAKEHQRHDAELKELIEKNRQYAAQQLAIITKLLQD